MACVFLGARLFRPLGSIRLAATAISPVGLNTPPRLRLFRPLGSIRLAAAAISPVGLNTPPRCAPPPAPAPRGGDGRKLRLDGAESKPHGTGYIKLRLGGAESKPHGAGMGANCAETAQNPNPT